MEEMEDEKQGKEGEEEEEEKQKMMVFNFQQRKVTLTSNIVCVWGMGGGVITSSS
jgi:hypothetical protein